MKKILSCKWEFRFELYDFFILKLFIFCWVVISYMLDKYVEGVLYIVRIRNIEYELCVYINVR